MQRWARVPPQVHIIQLISHEDKSWFENMLCTLYLCGEVSGASSSEAVEQMCGEIEGEIIQTKYEKRASCLDTKREKKKLCLNLRMGECKSHIEFPTKPMTMGNNSTKTEKCINQKNVLMKTGKKTKKISHKSYSEMTSYTNLVLSSSSKRRAHHLHIIL